MSPKADGTPTRADVRRAVLVVENLPTLLVAHRTKRGDSVRAAAEKIGIAMATVSLVERGLIDPEYRTILAVLDYLTRNR